MCDLTTKKRKIIAENEKKSTQKQTEISPSCSRTKKFKGHFIMSFQQKFIFAPTTYQIITLFEVKTRHDDDKKKMKNIKIADVKKLPKAVTFLPFVCTTRPYNIL